MKTIRILFLCLTPLIAAFSHAQSVESGSVGNNQGTATDSSTVTVGTLGRSPTIQSIANFPGILDPTPYWGGVNPDTLQPVADPAGWPASEVAGYYYVDNTHPSATNSGNTYGYPDKPRDTVPEKNYSWAEGDRKLVWGPGNYGGFSGGNQLDIGHIGGANVNEIFWITGIPGQMPKISGNLDINASSEWMGLRYLEADFSSVQPNVFIDNRGSVNHMIYRDLKARGQTATDSPTGSIISIVGDSSTNAFSEDIWIVDNDFADHGTKVVEDNVIGIRPNNNTRRVWISRNNIRNLGADSFLVGANRNQFKEDADRPEDTYIWDNDCADNGENCLDVKASVRTFFVGNRAHNFVSGVGSSGECITTHEQAWDVWILFNEIYDCDIGVASANGGSAGSRIDHWTQGLYVIGNNMYNIRNLGFDLRGGTAFGSVLNNTMTDIGTPVSVGGRGTWDIRSNIFGTRKTPANPDITFGAAAYEESVTLDYNLYQDPRVFIKARTYTKLKGIQRQGKEANGVVGDPLLTGTPGNITLGAGSPALAVGDVGAAYALFFAKYGLSIEFDIDANALAAPTDIGASQSH